MDDKVAENIQFHQETVETDQNSPLHLIREKEIEISGRVLARQARVGSDRCRRPAARPRR